MLVRAGHARRYDLARFGDAVTGIAGSFYVFGGFLILTGLKMLLLNSKEPNQKETFVVRVSRRLFPGRPLLAALMAIEFSDLIFAVDSIPAIFAITTDPFLVFTSNVFAMLGLRSLYFARWRG